MRVPEVVCTCGRVLGQSRVNRGLGELLAIEVHPCPDCIAASQPLPGIQVDSFGSDSQIRLGGRPSHMMMARVREGETAAEFRKRQESCLRTV